MKRSICICLIHITVISIGFSQSKRGNIGIFGNKVGLNFNTQPAEVFIPPTGPSDYSYETPESSASISDTEGNLLFYTNGIHIWDREHNTMSNGINILGAKDGFYNSTTQCLIIPVPKDPFLYYVITAQWQGGDLKYTLVDTRLNQGLGDVVFKDSLLYASTTEKMCLIKHNSGKSLWLVTHEFGTNHFRSFLIDEEGLNRNYIESAAGLVHVNNRSDGTGGNNAIGYMKASHAGNRIACAINGDMGTLQLFQFDKTTGIISDPITLSNAPNQFYGVEFSADNSKLYAANTKINALFQYDLSDGNPQDIINSKILIANNVRGALQLGPDDKIYVASEWGSYLDLISYPNLKDSLCGFQKNAVYLEGKAVLSGLPEFIYNTVEPEIIYEKYCSGTTTKFQVINIKTFSSIVWDFGDPSSGQNNTSNDISPGHIYQTPGRYKVTITVTFSDQTTFTYKQNILIFLSPTVELGNDTIVCNMSSVQITATGDPSVTQYKWSNGNTTKSATIQTTGKHWVKAMNSACFATDTINVQLLNTPSFTLRDTVICFDQILHIALKDPDLQYIWSDSVAGRERSITTTGTFTVKGTNYCGSSEVKIKVSHLQRLASALNDTLLCNNQKIAVDVTWPTATYRWHDETTSPNYTIDKSGTYWVELNNRCETITDTINVSYVTDEPFFIPNVITPNGDEYNNQFILDPRLTDAALTLFNRWGEMIYSNPEYKNDWSAEHASPGVYYYTIYDQCADQKLKGWLHVVR